MNRNVLSILALSLVCISSGLAAEPSSEQAKAIAEIKKLGGNVTIDEKSPGKPVVRVGLVGSAVTDAGLEHVERLTQLQELDLWSTEVTDAGLEHLKKLAQLRTLDLSMTKRVDDAGLEHLKG